MLPGGIDNLGDPVREVGLLVLERGRQGRMPYGLEYAHHSGRRPGVPGAPVTGILRTLVTEYDMPPQAGLVPQVVAVQPALVVGELQKPPRGIAALQGTIIGDERRCHVHEVGPMHGSEYFIGKAEIRPRLPELDLAGAVRDGAIPGARCDVRQVGELRTSIPGEPRVLQVRASPVSKKHGDTKAYRRCQTFMTTKCTRHTHWQGRRRPHRRQ